MKISWSLQGRRRTPNASAGLVGFAKIIMIRPGSITVAAARAIRAKGKTVPISD